MIEFKVIPPEERDKLGLTRKKRTRATPFIEALVRGETVFVPLTGDATEKAKQQSRLGQYYEVARNHQKKFTMRKTIVTDEMAKTLGVPSGTVGLSCWFYED